jgi:hypothetical protein
MINKPSKKIWSKLTWDQRTLWTVLSNRFSTRELYPEKSQTFKPTKKEIECIAHNLALIAVWIVGDRKKEDK